MVFHNFHIYILVWIIILQKELVNKLLRTSFVCYRKQSYWVYQPTWIGSLSTFNFDNLCNQYLQLVVNCIQQVHRLFCYGMWQWIQKIISQLTIYSCKWQVYGILLNPFKITCRIWSSVYYVYYVGAYYLFSLPIKIGNVISLRKPYLWISKQLSLICENCMFQISYSFCALF